MFGQGTVDLRQDARHILMDMQDPVGALLVLEAEGWDGVAAKAGSRFEVLEQLVADVFADVLLRFVAEAI